MPSGFKHEEGLSFFDLITRPDQHLANGACLRRPKMRIHFHRLQYQELIPFLNHGSWLNRKADNLTSQRTG